MGRDTQTCIYCGATRHEADWHRDSRTKACVECNIKKRREAMRAIAEVKKAVHRGDLERPSALKCADCASPASVYDHRDYTKPLDVEPVCRACNMSRGHAFNSFYRPAQSALAQPA